MEKQMKKILGILAAAALVFSAVSCAQDDGILTLDKAVSAAQANATDASYLANFSIDQNVTVNVGVTKSLTPNSTLYDLTFASGDSSVATAAWNKTSGAVEITGVGEGATVISVYATVDSIGSPIDVATIAVTVEKGIMATFAGLANATTDLSATCTSIDDSVYVTATDLEYELGTSIVDDTGTSVPWDENATAEYRAASGTNLTVNSYWVHDPTDHGKTAKVAEGQELVTFYTTVTAQQAVNVLGVSFAGGSNWGDTQLKISFTKNDETPYTTRYGSKESATSYAKTPTGSVSANSMELAADDTLKVSITVINKGKKALSDSNILNAGLGVFDILFAPVTE